MPSCPSPISGIAEVYVEPFRSEAALFYFPFKENDDAFVLSV